MPSSQNMTDKDCHIFLPKNALTIKILLTTRHIIDLQAILYTYLLLYMFTHTKFFPSLQPILYNNTISYLLVQNYYSLVHKASVKNRLFNCEIGSKTVNKKKSKY